MERVSPGTDLVFSLVLQLLVLMALFKARSTYPDYKLQLGFWPGWTGELGVPYIALSLPPENNNILTVVVK